MIESISTDSKDLFPIIFQVGITVSIYNPVKL
jgi:hypothetical protein